MSKREWVYNCEHASGEAVRTFKELDKKISIWAWTGCSSKYDQLVELRHLAIGEVSDLSPLAIMRNLESLELRPNIDLDLAPLSGLINLKSLKIIDPLIISQKKSKYSILDISPLSNLIQLESLTIEDSKISDLRFLVHMAGLRKLHIRGKKNPIYDLSPLYGLLELEDIYLRGTRIANLSPLAYLSKLKRVAILGIKNQISDLSPLSGILSLEKIILGDSRVSDLSHLANLVNLKEITIRGGNKQITDLSPISGLTNLKYLDMSDNQISDISPLAELLNLRTIYLRRNRISDISPISGLRNVGELDVRENFISDFSHTSHIFTVFGHDDQIPIDWEDEFAPYVEPIEMRDITRSTSYTDVKKVVGREVSRDNSKLYSFGYNSLRFAGHGVLMTGSYLLDPLANKLGLHVNPVETIRDQMIKSRLIDASLDMWSTLPMSTDNSHGFYGVFFPAEIFDFHKEQSTAILIYKLRRRFNLLNDDIREKVEDHLQALLEIDVDGHVKVNKNGHEKCKKTGMRSELTPVRPTLCLCLVLSCKKDL